MNLDKILRDLGLQDRAALLHSKKVTSNTFREMDGSAKQIILMSQKLGLNTEDILKIKAHIEEQTMRSVDAPSDQYRANQYMRNYPQNNQHNTFSSRQVPNSKSIEFRQVARPSGQMVFGHKGSLMKQEKVILDYGRKNRIQKLVPGNHGLAQSSQNLSRKGTHQLSMNMDQYLTSNSSNQQIKQANQAVPYSSNSRQKSSDVEQRQTSKSRSPELMGPNSHAGKNQFEKQNEMAPQTNFQNQAPQQRNQNATNRQSSVNSDSRQGQAKPQSSLNPSHNQTVTFGQSNQNQSISSGPASSTLQNQSRLTYPIQQKNYDHAGQQTVQKNVSVQETNLQAQVSKNLKVQEVESSNQLQQPKINEQIQPDKNILQLENQVLQLKQKLADQNSREQNQIFKRPVNTTIMNNQQVSPVPQQQLQDLGNQQSQEYLSEKLGKLCNKQDEGTPLQHHSVQQSNQYSFNNHQKQIQEEIIYQNNDQVQNDVNQSNQEQQKTEVAPSNISKQYDSIDHYHRMSYQPNNQVKSQNEQIVQIEEMNTNKHNNQASIQQKQMQSPSASDLDDPDARYEDECEDNNEDMHYEKQNENEMDNDVDKQFDDNQNYTDEEAVDLSEDADLQAEDESNSKLSDQMDNLPQVTHTSQHQQSTNNGQLQHHSRPTIGMKQPAQHYMQKYDVGNQQDEVGSIPSDTSSAKNTQAKQDQFYQQNLAQKYQDKIMDQEEQDMNSECEDEDQEEESEFLQKVSPQPLTDSYNQNQLCQQKDKITNLYSSANDAANKNMIDEEEHDSDNKSAEDNYDDEEMPDDNEYQRKVQLLHENRQKSAQHLWGAARVSQNNHVTSQSFAQNEIHSVAQNDKENQMNKISDEPEEMLSSEVSDTSEDDDQNDEVQEPQLQTQQFDQLRVQEKVPSQNQMQFGSKPNELAPQPLVAKNVGEIDHQKTQRSQHSIQQMSQIQQSELYLDVLNNQNSQAANGNAHESRDLQKQDQVEQNLDEQANRAVHNKCSNSSQNTFLDMQAGGETGQQSKHSSITHSLHRQHLQNSQQLSQKNINMPSQINQQISQNSTVNVEQKQKDGNNPVHNVNNGNGCTISQQSSFHSNNREPHHLLIENDEKSIAINQMKQQQVMQANQLTNNIHQTAFQPIIQAQPSPNNQKMFEQLNNQLQTQSQGSNFNLCLTQMNANNQQNSQVNNPNLRKHETTQIQQQFKKPIQQPMVIPQQFKPSKKEYQIAESELNQNKINSSSQQMNVNQSPYASQIQSSQFNGLQKGFYPVVSPSTTRNQLSNAFAKPQTSIMYSPDQQFQNQAQINNLPQKLLGVNKEIDAQSDLKQIMIDIEVKKAQEITIREVTEQVTNSVSKQVREQVTQEVTQRVKEQVETAMNEQHELKLQDLRDKYEQSANQQIRREEKLHHQIGQLESEVFEANKQLEGKQLEQKNLIDKKTELQMQCNELQMQIQMRSQQLQTAQQDKENLQQEHTATIQQLIREQQVDRSNIVILNEKIEKNATEKEQNQNKIQDLIDDIEMKNMELSEQQHKYKSIQQSLENMQTKIQDKDSQIEGLHVEIENLQTQFQEKQNEQELNEQRLKDEAEKAKTELLQTIEEMKRDREQVEIEKAQMQKQVEEAQLQTKKAIEREQALIKKQRSQSEAPKQEVTTPKQLHTNSIEKRSLTLSAQINHVKSPSLPQNLQSAQSDKQSRLSNSNALSPQRFQLGKEAKTANIVMQNMQLRQERLQQLLQLQMKQEELMKLQNQVKSNQSKISQGQQQANNESTSFQQKSSIQTKKAVQNNEIPNQKNEVNLKKTENISQLADDVVILTNKDQFSTGKVNGFSHSVDLMDDDHGENEDQYQDDDNLIYTSGSKNKMHNIKEESSYLPDCVVAEKNEKKKIVKKVRFHDDEQLIDSSYKANTRQQDAGNPIADGSQSSSVNAQATRATSLTGQGQLVGKKRIRLENGVEQIQTGLGENHLLSQEILSGSACHDNGSQQFERYDDEVDHNQLEIIDRHVALGGLKSEKNQERSQKLIVDEEQNAYKRQRTAVNDDQNYQGVKDNKIKQIKEKVIDSQNLAEYDEADELPVKSSGHRLRKKIFQEDTANMSASGDEFHPEGQGKLQRKRRKNMTGRSVGDQSVYKQVTAVQQQQQQKLVQGVKQFAQSGKQGAYGQGMQTGANGNHHQRTGGKARQMMNSDQAGFGNQKQSNAAGVQAQNASMEQSMKQIVGANDQYVKKNPGLMSMIQRMARK